MKQNIIRVYLKRVYLNLSYLLILIGILLFQIGSIQTFGLTSYLTDNELVFKDTDEDYGFRHSANLTIDVIDGKTLFSTKKLLVDQDLNISGHATANALTTTHYRAKRVAFCYVVTTNAGQDGANEQSIPEVVGGSSTTIINFSSGVNRVAGNGTQNPSNPNQFKAPVNGYYYIDSTISIQKYETDASPDTINLGIYVNNVSNIAFTINPNQELGIYSGTPPNAIYSISGIVKLNKDDVVDIRLGLTDLQYYINERIFSGYYISKLETD